MDDRNVVRLSVVGQIIRRRWRLLAAFAVVGAVLGAGASLLLSPGYRSESQVVAQGSLDQPTLLTEAQIAVSQIVLDRTAAALGEGITGADLQGSVTAGVLKGNVILISGSAKNAGDAQQLTDRVTQEYVRFSTQIATNATTAAAQTQDPSQPQGQSQGGASSATVRQTRLSVIEPATLPSGPASPSLIQLIGGGAVLFFALGILGHLLAGRLDKRQRSESEIAAALGAPVVGQVEVAATPPGLIARSQTRGSRFGAAWMQWLLRDGVGWDVPQLASAGDETSQEVRYRRVLARLRNDPDAALRLLVLVPEHDAAAHQAVAQLAVAAGRAGSPTTVVTDDADFSALVKAMVDGIAEPGTIAPTILGSSDTAPNAHRTVLHVVDIATAHPTIPERSSVTEALVVLTAGTRTSWELLGIGEACLDASISLAGVLVVVYGHPAAHPPVQDAQADTAGLPSDGNAMAGSA